MLEGAQKLLIDAHRFVVTACRLDRLALARGTRITRTLAQVVLGEMVGGGDFGE